VIKILVIPERYGLNISGCGWIRLIHPYKNLSFTEGYDMRVGSWKVNKNWKPDVIVTQRIVASPESLQSLEECISSGTKLIFDLDDDLINIPSEHPDYKEYIKFSDPIRHFVERADIVTVSTAHLARSLGLEGNPKVAVIENEISSEHWFGDTGLNEVMANTNRGTNLLYFGTSSHHSDWKMVEEPTLDWLSDNSDANLTLIGVTKDRFYLSKKVKKIYVPDSVSASYPAFVSWIRSINNFDIGLAPLIDSSFNRSKSALKVLEYSALGLVSVTSRIEPYSYIAGKYPSLVLSDIESSSWYQSLDIAREYKKSHSVESIKSCVKDYGAIREGSSAQRKLVELIKGIVKK
jgi:hypothetical protein